MGGIVLCLVAAALLGIQMPLAKLAFEAGSDTISFSLFRSVMAVPVCFGLAAMQRYPLGIAKPARWGLLGIALGTAGLGFGYLGGVERIPASLAALIFYTYPLLVLIVGAVQARAIPGPKRIVAFILAFVGLAAVFGPNFGGIDPLGVGLCIFAAVCATVYFLCVPAASRYMPGLTLMAWTNVGVALLFIPALPANGFNLPQTGEGMAFFITAGTFYAIGMTCAFYGIAKCGSETSAMLFNFEPLSVLVVSAALLGEILTMGQYAGGVCVLIALILVSQRAAPKPPLPPTSDV